MSIRYENLTGRVFGMLTVIEKDEDHVFPNGKRGTRWIVKCSCPKERVFSVLSTSLKSGSTTSCHGEGKKIFEDLSGEIYGTIKVLSFDSIKRGNTYWLCYCMNCGNTKSIQAGRLKNKIKSCGCLNESFIASELKKYFVEYHSAVVEYKVLKNPGSGYWLPYDIYLPDKNVFIEVNDSQHYKVDSWHFLLAKQNGTTPEEEFEYQKKKDRMKRKFARNHGTYIEINLMKIKTIQDALSYIQETMEKIK